MPLTRTFPAPTRQDRALQFSSIRLGVEGRIFPYITALSFEHSLEPGEVRGTAPHVMGLTLGEYKANGSITIITHRVDEFLDIIDPERIGYMDAVFDLQATTGEPGRGRGQSAIRPRTHTLSNCRLTAQNSDWSTGNAALTTVLPLYIHMILWDGRPPYQGVPGLTELVSA